MKTTLSVILALTTLAYAEDITLSSGPFVGVSSVQTEYERLCTAVGYQRGTDFTLSFTISAASLTYDTVSFFNFGDSFTLASQEGKYVGFGTSTTVPSGTLTSTQQDGVNVFSLSSIPNGWFSKNSNGSLDEKSIVNASFEIAVVGDSTTITMIRSDGAKNIVTLNGIRFNADDLEFDYHKYSGNGTTSGDSISFKDISFVPEPTTATLSLLALVGLAAHRRRKEA